MFISAGEGGIQRRALKGLMGPWSCLSKHYIVHSICNFFIFFCLGNNCVYPSFTLLINQNWRDVYWRVIIRTDISCTLQFTVKHQTVISKDTEKIWYGMRKYRGIPRENFSSLYFSNRIHNFKKQNILSV